VVATGLATMLVLEIVHSEFGGVDDALKIHIQDLQIWLYRVLAVINPIHRIGSRDAGIGDYDVDAVVRGVFLRGFEDGELVCPDRDVAFVELVALR
jgi:hypothetical protein